VFIKEIIGGKGGVGRGTKSYCYTVRTAEGGEVSGRGGNWLSNVGVGKTCNVNSKCQEGKSP